jgi:glycosyltransferase involved in cell wall biosynthesis
MTNDIRISFVIPTYNRAQLVLEAIDSAIAWLGNAKDGEIVVVDNCSTDGTVEQIRQRYAAQIEVGLINLVARPVNGGVITSKNLGARTSRGQWLVFLDSDDVMIASSAASMRMDLAEFSDAPLLFFRCEDFATGALLGPPQQGAFRLSLSSYLNGPPIGECLPVVRKDVAARFPYDERLSGWEGLAYPRILREMRSLIVSAVVARRYRAEGDDRLCAMPNRLRRARTMALGNWLWAAEWWMRLKPSRTLNHLAKAAYYGFYFLIRRPGDG